MSKYEKELYEVVQHINKTLNTDKYYVQFAYGEPRLEVYTHGTCSESMSPRLPSKQLIAWMYAFLKGIDIGRESNSY